MRIAFISTILDHAWGGADTLWTRAAEAAISRGDQVFLAVSPIVAAHARVQQMIAQGALVCVRPPPPRPAVGLIAAVARKVTRALQHPREPLLAALDQFTPDLVVLSGGGTYDLLLEPALSRWLQVRLQRFRIVANWQSENPLLPTADLDAMRTVLPRADHLGFVSHRNLATTRRHLLLPLLNATVLHNPLRCAPGATLPWPPDVTLRFATVGRLHGIKGIALLLHALKTSLGATTGWHLQVTLLGS